MSIFFWNNHHRMRRITTTIITMIAIDVIVILRLKHRPSHLLSTCRMKTTTEYHFFF